MIELIEGQGDGGELAPPGEVVSGGTSQDAGGAAPPQDAGTAAPLQGAGAAAPLQDAGGAAPPQGVASGQAASGPRARAAGTVGSPPHQGPLLRPLEALHGVELEVTVELGRTRMLLRDLLGVQVGSLVELDRPAGSPVDLLVNGVMVARGEVVVIDDEFAVRVTDLVEDGAVA